MRQIFSEIYSPLLIVLLFTTSLSYAEDSSEEEANRGEEIIVTSDFRLKQQQLVASSITVLGEIQIKDSAEQHFEELINWVPNLNFAGGTSRPRFFQIRGIGERSQYQGAPNPSVGFIIDDIDFSGIGGIATLFDVQQIEVLKGPQGSRYGANALAGLITINSVDPSADTNGLLQLTIAEDNTLAVGVAAGGEINPELSYRLALQQHQSDGFRNNLFLDRTDTNERDETTARIKLLWQPDENFNAKITLVNIQLDNGYDAFVQDNSFNTLSDLPGRDEQHTTAASVRINWLGNDAFDVTSITSTADSDILFSFDGDWGNPVLWGVNGPYDFTSATDRQRFTFSQELRFISKPGAEILSGNADWLVGFYLQRLEEDNQILDLFNAEIFNDLSSKYRANTKAMFAQIDYHLSAYTSINAGLRIENRGASYTDSNAQDLNPDETMFGGHVALEHLHANGDFSYLKLSRGYKAGGFNIGTNIPTEQIEFDTEFVWNLEAGMNARWLDQKLVTQFSVFYMKRDEQQVETSFQVNINDPLSFIFVTDNAASGENYGVEFQSSFYINQNWTLINNIGYLKTQFNKALIGTRNLKGRAQAHAPEYSYATGIIYRNNFGIFSQLEITGKDEFFFSNSHDKISKSYNLVNIKLGYETENWSIYLWGRNIFDKAYAVRGFFFANEPPDFIDTLYTRQGDPAYWGFTSRLTF